uniref:Biogenesis of lysosome-related organelles complex 1 subunit 5 n=1 Tax=Globodera pallida TaxID=36090 RepID=A0A183BXP0_GLOPA
MCEMADDLIKAEMYALMEWDAEQKEPSHLYTREEREKARKMIEEEATKMAEEEGIEPVLDSHVWQNLHKREQIEVLSDRFKTLFNWMQQQAHRVQKVEKRVKNIHSNLHAKLDELHREKEKLLLELKTFHRLEENEQKAIVKRTNALTQELREQEEREKHLQKHFSHLQHRKWELEQTQARERATVEAEPVRYASFESAGRE